MKTALIIGAGAGGCVAAHMLRGKGYEITIIERSSEIGAGVRTKWYAGHPYTQGPRHFLTKSESVWAYMNALCPLQSCGDHQFWSFVPEDGEFYNFPINTDDIDRMPEAEAIRRELRDCDNAVRPNNLEQFWIGAVGTTLYGKMIRRYNEKMWQMPSSKLDTFSWSPKGSPIKVGGSHAAWTEAMSGYPLAADGYNQWFNRCVEDCTVRLNTKITAFDLKSKRIRIGDEDLTADIIVSTISPDIPYDFCFGRLPYIGRDFHKIVLPVEFALPEHVYWVYEAGTEAWTRTTEFKKFTHHQSPHTLLGLEIPSDNGKHYPIPTKTEQTKAACYHAMMPRNVYSLGRAGSYRYGVDIAGCIEQAMEMVKHVDGGWEHPVPLQKYRD